MRTIALIFVLTVILAVPGISQTLSARAGPEFEEAYAMFQRGDYGAAMKKALPLAREGNSDGQMLVGWLHLAGLGVSKDQDTGLHWFLKAADQGYPIAQLSLGHLYYRGNIVPHDLAEAAKWCSIARNRLETKKRQVSAANCVRDATEFLTPAQIVEIMVRVRDWRPAQPKPAAH